MLFSKCSARSCVWTMLDGQAKLRLSLLHKSASIRLKTIKEQMMEHLCTYVKKGASKKQHCTFFFV